MRFAKKNGLIPDSTDPMITKKDKRNDRRDKRVITMNTIDLKGRLYIKL